MLRYVKLWLCIPPNMKMKYRHPPTITTNKRFSNLSWCESDTPSLETFEFRFLGLAVCCSLMIMRFVLIK